MWDSIVSWLQGYDFTMFIGFCLGMFLVIMLQLMQRCMVRKPVSVPLTKRDVNIVINALTQLVADRNGENAEKAATRSKNILGYELEQWQIRNTFTKFSRLGHVKQHQEIINHIHTPLEDDDDQSTTS